MFGTYSGMGLAAARLLHELGLDFPVVGELYADFILAGELPAQIDAIFLCRGIDLRADASNSVEMQKVNFLGYKYLLEKVFSK